MFTMLTSWKCVGLQLTHNVSAPHSVVCSQASLLCV